MSDNESSCLEMRYTESPASWTTHFLHPSGYQCQLTLRAESCSAVLAKAKDAISQLSQNGCLPANANQGPTQPAKGHGANPTRVERKTIRVYGRLNEIVTMDQMRPGRNYTFAESCGRRFPKSFTWGRESEQDRVRFVMAAESGLYIVFNN